MTGGRLKRVAQYVRDEEVFCFTYSYGVSDVNITELIDFHKSYGKKATLTAVYSPGRFGVIDIHSNHQITSFKEKPKGDGGMINGVFILSPEVIGLIKDGLTVWEREPLESLAQQSEMMAYQHHGFWQPMVTLRDKNYLKKLWSLGNAPWKSW